MKAVSKPQPLTFEKLQELGAFVPKKPFPAPIKWGGETIPLYVRKLGCGALIDLAEVAHSKQRNYAASIIEAAVCFDPDGEESFAFEDAYRLVSGLMEMIIAEVNRVNEGLSNGR